MVVLALLAAATGLALWGSRPALGQEDGQGTRTPRPSVTPTPGCRAAATHQAYPERLRVGEATTATVHVDIECPAAPAEPLHIAIVMDASAAMTEEGVGAETRAVRQIVRDLRLSEFPGIRVGIIGFSENARIRCPLTGDAERLNTCVTLVRGLYGARAIGHERWTLDRAMADGFRMIRAGRAGSAPRPARECLFLFSVGPEHGDCGELLRAARLVKAAGVLVATVCVGRDCAHECLREVASSPRYFFQVDNAGGLAAIFSKIRSDLLAPAAPALTLYYVPAPGVNYVPDSAVPAATAAADGPGLTWDRQYAGSDGVTVTLRLAPTFPGRQPLAREAGATWQDVFGRPARVLAPTAEVIVDAP